MGRRVQAGVSQFEPRTGCGVRSAEGYDRGVVQRHPGKMRFKHGEPNRSISARSRRSSIRPRQSACRPNLPRFATPPPRSGFFRVESSGEGSELFSAMQTLRLVLGCSARFAMLALIAVATLAQGSVTIPLASLAPGEVLGEQFAALGIHFAQDFGPAANTALPPPVLDRGSVVGSATFAHILFDSPVQAVSLDVAETDRTPGTLPNLHVLALTGFPGGQIQSEKTDFFPLDQWHRITLAIGPGTRLIELVGWLYQGENFTHQFYFDKIQVTFVPEPTAAELIGLGVSALFLFRFRKLRSLGHH